MTRRWSSLMAGLALLGLLGVLGPALAASAAPGPPTGPTGSTATRTLVLPHRLAPQLGQDAHGDQTLVTGVPNGHGQLGQLLVRQRRSGGTWGPDRPLTPAGLRLANPVLAVAASGAAVAAWSEGSGNGLSARVRGRAGHWGPVTRLVGVRSFFDLQAVINRSGDTIAVASTADLGYPGIGYYHDGRWTTTRNPAGSGARLAVDDAGDLFAGTTLQNREADNRVTVSRMTPDGHWSGPMLIRGDGQKPTDVEVLASPSGELVLLVGRATDGWTSTYDGEIYWSTAYRVLHVQRWGEPMRLLWQRHGVVAVDGHLTRHGNLRLTFLQWQDPVVHVVAGSTSAGHDPTSVALRAIAIGVHRHGPPHTLAEQPASLGGGSYDWATTFSQHEAPGGVLRVWWRPVYLVPPDPDASASVEPPQPDGDQHVAVTTSSRFLADAALPGTALPETDVFPHLLDTSAAGPDAAWVERVVYRRHAGYGDGPAAVDGTVVLGAAP